jgi:hypothetical protein
MQRNDQHAPAHIYNICMCTAAPFVSPPSCTASTSTSTSTGAGTDAWRHPYSHCNCPYSCSHSRPHAHHTHPGELI